MKRIITIAFMLVISVQLHAQSLSKKMAATAMDVRKGYLSASLLAVTQTGYPGIVKKFIENGTFNNHVNLNSIVSAGGSAATPWGDGSIKYYLSEKVIEKDPKGTGSFLLASNEMEMAPALPAGKGAVVMLDNYFNHETKKDTTGKMIAWHYTWDDMSNGGFSLLGDIFKQQGADIETLSAAPTSANLKKAGIYIIVDPDTEKESDKPNYVQPNNVTAISDWVKAGGVLALFSNDSVNAEFPHFNTLAEKFGIHFNQDVTNRVINNQFEQGAINIPANNPIFKTAKKVFIKEFSSLRLTSPAEAVLKKGNVNVVAVAKYGKGLVFAVGDPWFYNEYLDGKKLPLEYENYKAATDFVKWILSNRKK